MRAADRRTAILLRTHIALLGLPPLICAIAGSPRAGATLLFYAGIALALFAVSELAALGTRRVWLGRLALAIYLLGLSPLLLAGTIHAKNVADYGPLLADTAEALFQTDYREAVDYVRIYTGGSTIALTGLWCLVLIGTALLGQVRRGPPCARRPAEMRLLLVVGVVLAIVGCRGPLLIALQAHRYGRVLEAYQASRERLRESDSLPRVDSSYRGHLVLAIGESVNRHHLSLYGYPRDTTPNLSRRRDELLVFEDVISTDSHTSTSLLDALSFNDRSDPLAPHEVPDLLSVAHRAGFETTWLSNQNAIGVWDDQIASLARLAQTRIYHSGASGEVLARNVYDEAMLDPLARTVASRGARKLTILHTMTAHAPYCEVIPEPYRSLDGSVFAREMGRALYGDAPAKDVDCYDAAISYLDVFLERVIQRLETSPEPSLLLFFADHGEAPMLGSGHDNRLHSHQHVEVPLVVWGNPVWRERNGQRWAEMTARRLSPVSLIDLSYAVSDLGEIRGLEGAERRSFFSPDYEPFARTTVRGAVGYDEGSGRADAYEKARASMRRVCESAGVDACRKLWAHRVNTLGAMLEARTIFAGVELDVVYDSEASVFRVHHPPADDVGLTLERFLELDDGRIEYWLDWKNSTRANTGDALARLSALDERRGIRRRTVVETGRPHALTFRIAEEGWESSYYLRTSLEMEAAIESERGRALASEIDATLSRYGYTGVSFDIGSRPFVAAQLRDAIERRALDAYTWDDRARLDIGDLERLRKLAGDHLAKVVLVGFASPFDL